jgi:hypothetical protein
MPNYSDNHAMSFASENAIPCGPIQLELERAKMYKLGGSRSNGVSGFFYVINEGGPFFSALGVRSGKFDGAVCEPYSSGRRMAIPG